LKFFHPDIAQAVQDKLIYVSQGEKTGKTDFISIWSHQRSAKCSFLAAKFTRLLNLKSLRMLKLMS